MDKMTEPVLPQEVNDYLGELRTDPRFNKAIESLEQFANQQQPTWNPSHRLQETDFAYAGGVSDGMAVLLKLLSGN